MTQPSPAILALVSAPLVNLSGEPVDRLDANRELADLESWLREPGRAVELYVEWAETERLQRTLLRGRFDALHYTGHGHPEALAFEDGHGGLHPLTAGHLAALICPGGQLAFRLAFLSACHKELDDALASYAQALDLFRAVGSRLGEANTLLALAPFSENAKEVFGTALSLYEAIGDQYSTARGLFYYAQFLAAQGQTDQAIAALEQCRDRCLAVNLTDHAAAAQQAINELSGQ